VNHDDEISRIEDMVRRSAEQLGEHIEHVQIMATWNIDGLSYTTMYGAGNWYARQGLAQAFIARDMAQEQAREMGIMMDRREEDKGEQF